MKNESEPKFEEDTNLEPEEIEETPQVKKPNKKKIIKRVRVHKPKCKET